MCSTTKRSPSRSLDETATSVTEWRRMPPLQLEDRTSMWDSLCQMLARLWRRPQQSSEERRVAKARERFWAEVREGEREAEANSIS